jgi:hypothetical protein
MTWISGRLLVAVALLAPAGCQGRPAPAPVDAAAAPSSYAGRLEAALSISNVGTRDEALATLALDAAGGGDAASADAAIDGISNVGLRDQTAADAAARLAKSGKEGAVAIARRIGNVGLRDDTLARIAKGAPK